MPCEHCDCPCLNAEATVLATEHDIVELEIAALNAELDDIEMDQAINVMNRMECWCVPPMGMSSLQEELDKAKAKHGFKTKDEADQKKAELKAKSDEAKKALADAQK